MIKKVLKRMRKYKNVSYYNDDLFVVEFPKSGITWLTTILANTICIQNQLAIYPTHFNLEQFVGDIHVSNLINNKPYSFPGYRLLKSHSKYTQRYRHVVYIIRHPYSVMKSYFHYTVSNGTFSKHFGEFLTSDRYGIKAWCDHVNSWINPASPLKLHLVKYEDLIDNPLDTIGNLYLNIGWDVSKNCIQESISKSTFQTMKESDELYKENCPFRKYSFVREGNKYTFLNRDNKIYINRYAGKILNRFYPETIPQEKSLDV